MICEAHLALEDGLVVDRTSARLSCQSQPSTDLDSVIETHGFTITPIAQSLTVGLRPLSGGGWNAPQYGYSET